VLDYLQPDAMSLDLLRCVLSGVALSRIVDRLERLACNGFT
jgi:hypothetical protein